MPRCGGGVNTVGFFLNLFGDKASDAAAQSTVNNANIGSDARASAEVRTAEAQQAPAASDASASSAVEALCPVSGTAMDIADVADQVFASKAMGDGIGIKPTSGELIAPFSGAVEALFPTGHALAIKHASGVGIMLHIGIDTVAMNGEGFTAHVAQGDHVKQGQLLVAFDRDKIAEAGYDDTTMVIAAEVPAGLSVAKCKPGAVSTGQCVLSFS